jgi:hypothetical protein
VRRDNQQVMYAQLENTITEEAKNKHLLKCKGRYEDRYFGVTELVTLTRTNKLDV